MRISHLLIRLTTYAFKIDDIEAAHSHVNFMSLASDRAAYRLRDQYDQDVLGYLAGYEQSAKHGTPDTARTTLRGSKAVSTAGSDELLTSMKLFKEDFGNITSPGSGNSIPLAPRLQVKMQDQQPLLPHFRL